MEPDGRQRRILESSLGDTTGLGYAIEMVVGGLLFCVPTVAARLLFGAGVLDSNWSLVGITVISLAVLVGFMLARERVAIARDRRRVKKLGFGFDARSYLEQLSLPHDDGPVVAFIHFVAPLDGGKRALMATAARRLCRDLVAADWDQNRGALRLATAPKMGIESAVAAGGATRWHSNAAAHKAAMRILRRVVPRLNAAHAVKLVEVELTGRVSKR